MAIIKILPCRGQSGGSALDYVIYKHDESTRLPILDENGNRELREDFYLSGINCAPLAFPTEMTQLESVFGKNLDPEDIRMYQIIISYNPKDAENYILDGPRAQMLSMTLVQQCLAGTLGIACTHMDGDHHSGNIHTHVFLSSIQYTDEISIIMKYPKVEKPGDKIGFSRSTVMQLREHLSVIVEEADLHPDNLFQIAGDRISNGEYWATYRRQVLLDEENQKRREAGLEVVETRFRGRKQQLRDALKDAMFQSISEEDFRNQLEMQYQVEISENGAYWRFGFIGDDQDYASSTLGANYYKEEICRVIENNRRHPERMEEYLAEKARSLEAEKVPPKPDITTISGCRELFQKSEDGSVLAASIRKLALRMETTESQETLQEKWTPLAGSLQFVVEHQIRSLAQLDPMEKTLQGNLTFYHTRKQETNLILRDQINILHYAEVIEQFSNLNHQKTEKSNDGTNLMVPKRLREVEDAWKYFENAGIKSPVSSKKAWEEKMSVQRMADYYGRLEAKTSSELQSLKETRAVLEPWKALLPSEPIPVTHVLEMITPRDIQSRETQLYAYLTQNQSIQSNVRSEFQNVDIAIEGTVLTEHSKSETLPMAVGLASVSYDYVLENELGHIPERSVPDISQEQKKTETQIPLGEEYNERIRKLMERRKTAADNERTAGRIGGEGTDDTAALIEEARAGIRRADAIEQDSQAKRDDKIAQRTDRDASRKRRAAEERTSNERERGDKNERGRNSIKRSRSHDYER